MSDKEIEIYNENADEIKIRPYEHHAKYYETDQMGIIHHSNYIKWMEEARMDLMDQIGLSYKQMEEMEIISPVLSVSCEYHSMVHFDDTIASQSSMNTFWSMEGMCRQYPKDIRRHCFATVILSSADAEMSERKNFIC